jgi:hypothetical protein
MATLLGWAILQDALKLRDPAPSAVISILPLRLIRLMAKTIYLFVQLSSW